MTARTLAVTLTSAIVDKGTPLRFCYTMTNTGDEALNLHDVYDSHIGQVAGPGHDHVVQPGDGIALTATGAFDKSALHGVTWEAIGVESDTVVHGIDGLFVTVLGPAITLDMTVMVDDGHGTCGTQSEISVPAGTPVLYCYTMTDSGDETVNYHHLDDDQLGTLLDGLDREVDPGNVLVHTEVAVITETVTSTAQWATLSQGTGTDVWAVDGVTVEIADDAETTTTTNSTAPGPDPCIPTTPAPTPGPPATSPPATNPPVTSTPTTTTSTSTTTSTTTTTTIPRSTTTTELGIVLPTTSTTLGEPAGFAVEASPGRRVQCHRPVQGRCPRQAFGSRRRPRRSRAGGDRRAPDGGGEASNMSTRSGTSNADAMSNARK